METIIAAAIKINGYIISTYDKGHHEDIVKYLTYNKFSNPTSNKPGFITSTGRFVDRSEAKIIATNSNQIKDSNFTILYSKDIW